MNYILRIIKKSLLWSYARNTWQWDVLCVVILIFIFLTPKSWFENSERRGYLAHQNSTASTVLISPERIVNAQDKGEVEQVVRTFTGRNDVKIVSGGKV